MKTVSAHAQSAAQQASKTKPAASGARKAGVWAKYGVALAHDAFLEPDPELEALMDAPIAPGLKAG